ncbi:EamA family transporter [Sinomicrobium oceani]|uniref:EamA family transporter n=1 Tax=Sinomicrobium oceani TaxID=1150368 RepID=UPI00227BC263|nr:EamA family transporter [Sinomicrobium oceani]
MNKNLLAYLSLSMVCLVWCSTYFTIRIGVAIFPLFLISNIRQIMAGGIILVALKIIRKPQLQRSDLINQSIIGILMVTLGNGVIGWCERYITSRLAASILSLIPVFAVVINYLFGFDRKRPRILILFGLTLSCLEIILILRKNTKAIANPEYFPGMLIAFGACLAWVSGSVFCKFKISNYR